MKTIPSKLFVLEMANNHMGEVAHGIEVIRQFGAVCRQFPEFKFACKLIAFLASFEISHISKK